MFERKSDGVGFTLYDYKTGSENYTNTINQTWNVGGKGLCDSLAADYAIRIFNDTDTRYGYDDAVLCHATWHDISDMAA